MAAEQIGEEYLIGIGGTIYSATVDPESTDQGDDADEQIIKDDQGATKSVITQDRRRTLSLNVQILSDGSFDPPRKNTVVPVTTPGAVAPANYRITGTPRVTASRGQIARLAVDLIREDSMASVYDA